MWLSCHLLLGWTLAAHADPSNQQAYPELDWYPTTQLDPEQQRQIDTGCCGAYVDPLTNTPGPGVETPDRDATEQEALTISGEGSHITKNSTVVTGAVELLQGGRRLTGDRAEIFHDPQAVELEGNVGFREPGFLLRGKKAAVNLEQDTFQLEGARYVLHETHVHGQAQSIRRDADGVIALENSTYTYCEPHSVLWQLHSEQMSLDFEQGQGKAQHVRLEVLEVPVFYFPYLRFPIGHQRQSGLLTPSLAGGEDGLDFALPYYFNLAPHYDLVLTPRVIEDRGLQLSGEFRHLSPWLHNTLSASWLGDDRKADRDRWLLGLQSEGGQRQPWFTEINAARVSDSDYFEDLDNSGLSVKKATHLKQQWRAGYLSDHWDTAVEVLQYQTLRDQANVQDPYEQVPEFSALGSYALPGKLSLSLSQHISQFDHNDSTRITGSRLASDLELSWHGLSTTAYQIKPTTYVFYRAQQLDNQSTNQSPEAFVPAFTLDSALFFEKSGEIYRQLLQPRLRYAYVDYEKQSDFALFDADEISFDYDQLFSIERLTGYDRVGDRHEITAALEYRWLDQASGQEWMQLGVGQAFYQEDRQVHGFSNADYALLPTDYLRRYRDNHSPIAVHWHWQLNPHLLLNSDIAWRASDDETEHSAIGLHYQGPGDTLFSVAYRHRELLTQLNAATYIMETVQQSDASAYWPMDNQWALIGSTRYDFSHDRIIELLAGFQYEDCCWRLRAAFRRWEDNPNEAFNTDLHEHKQGIYFEVQFKNLASTGNKIQSLLEENIFGYSSSD